MMTFAPVGIASRIGKRTAPAPLRMVRNPGYTAPINVMHSNGVSDGDNQSSGALMEMMQLLLAKVSNLESQLALQAAKTSVTLQESVCKRKRTSDKVLQNVLLEWKATAEHSPDKMIPLKIILTESWM